MARRFISHSEVDQFNQCERKHHYAFTERLEAVNHNINLSTGNSGHAFFKMFFISIKEGFSVEEAYSVGLSAGINSGDGWATAASLCTRWVKEIWPTLDWEIIDVETTLLVTVSETLVFPFTFDLLIRTGNELVVVDHKFVGDPYPADVIELFPQLPKYMVGMRSHGIDVKYAIYNMLRTRATTKDVLTMVPTRPSQQRLLNSFKEQIEGMKRIEAGIPLPMRSATKINCSNCQFKVLCSADLNGEDTSLLKSTFFKPNTYGYSE